MELVRLYSLDPFLISDYKNRKERKIIVMHEIVQPIGINLPMQGMSWCPKIDTLYSVSRKFNNSQYLARIKQRIEETYKYPLNVSDLAREVGVSRSKLQHEFPSVFGQNIQDYQLNIRINVAKEYLVNTDFPLKKIAMVVGYKSCRSFIRAFKKRTGTTPEKYRFKKIA